MIVNVSIFLGN